MESHWKAKYAVARIQSVATAKVGAITYVDERIPSARKGCRNRMKVSGGGGQQQGDEQLCQNEDIIPAAWRGGVIRKEREN